MCKWIATVSSTYQNPKPAHQHNLLNLLKNKVACHLKPYDIDWYDIDWYRVSLHFSDEVSIDSKPEITVADNPEVCDFSGCQNYHE